MTAVERVLDHVDALAHDRHGQLAELVALPSVSGTDAENEAIHDMAHRLGALGIDVDHWQVPLDEMLARPTSPGSRWIAPRRGAWSAGCRVRGPTTVDA